MRFLMENLIRSDFFIEMVNVGFMYVGAYSRGTSDPY
jgi:hypothetical protein